MNSVQLVGRFTATPELKYTSGENSIAITRFILAVDRKVKNDNVNNADFISCVAFSKTAEFIEKYFSKGQRIGLNGRIQTGSYTNKDGQKVYTTDVVVESVEFVESKTSAAGATEQSDNTDADGFMSIPDGVEDEGLPFN